MEGGGLLVGIDTGGTFTDVFAEDGRVYKLPSTPANPVEAIIAGLRAIGVSPGSVVAHGTTVATNAVLERKGARTGLLTTDGFQDVLAIRRQNRPALYDLLARWPEPLVPDELRLGVPERLDFRGEVLRPLDEVATCDAIEQLHAEGVEAIAVCLLYAYVEPAHEDAVGRLVRERFGDEVPFSVSHEVAPHYGEYERTSTTVVNAYVMPVMQGYLNALVRHARELGVRTLHVMHSNGGLISAGAAARRPVLSILSGPAAGVVGARAVAREAGYDQIITFDMGGTSTDVAVVPGEVLERSDGEISSFPLLVPMLTIETVGAGGGSVARVDAGGGVHVGPESAGADPGPAAYGRGDRPTVTDANLVLGRLAQEGLLGGAMPLDLQAAREALQAIAHPLDLTVEQAAWSVIRLANSNMERAVRSVTLQRGFDPRRFTLVSFGGAGPLHAAELADGLGMTRILVPPHPGIMCAYGLAVPDLQRDFFRTVLLPLDERCAAHIEEAYRELETQAWDEIGREDVQGFGEPVLTRSVDVRYVGQSFDLRLSYGSLDSLYGEFAALYERRYGYATPEAPAEVVNVRVRATLPRLNRPRPIPPWPETGRPAGSRPVYFGSAVGVTGLQQQDAETLWRPALPVGRRITGPAVVDQYDSTTLVPPGWVAKVDQHFNLVLRREA